MDQTLNGGEPLKASREHDKSPAGSGHEVILQAFNWECHTMRDAHRRPAWLEMLTEKADAISEAGITAVWLPPPCHAISEEGYLPQDYEQLDTAYGSEADLRRCVAALHKRQIKALADLVLNHRCAQEKGPDGKWNKFTGRCAWDASWLCSNEQEQYGGVGERKPDDMVFPYAPNLDHSQERLRKDLVSYLRWLKEHVGYDGWRFDFAKGYRGSAVKEYISATNPAMSVGEFWTDCNYDEAGSLLYDQDSHRQAIVDWCDATGGASTAFDFTTKGILQDALEKGEYWRLKDAAGKPPGVVGWWPSRAVTFLDNHDTGSTQQHWPFPPHLMHQGYAYILTHPGTPCVFYDHLWSDGMRRTTVWGSLKRLLSSSHKQPPVAIASAVSHSHGSGSLDRHASGGGVGDSASRWTRRGPRNKDSAVSQPSLRTAVIDLITIRQRNGIHCRSPVSILQADGSVYSALVDGKLVVKLGPGSWSPTAAGVKPPLCAQDWTLAASGADYAVWEASRVRATSGESSAPQAIPRPTASSTPA